MSTLYIDCEFNDFQGELISLALVDGAGREFYEVLECGNPSPWVRENVIPILGKKPVSLKELQANLYLFLSQYPKIHIVADWPEDISHFCQTLITGPGERLGTPPLSLEIRRYLDALSDIPHNALSDARAIMKLAEGL